jgi:hypothetical protein
MISAPLTITPAAKTVTAVPPVAMLAAEGAAGVQPFGLGADQMGIAAAGLDWELG